MNPAETLGSLVHDALGDVIAWDSRSVRSLRWLITRPGHLSREWAEGRRARYVPPFRLYIWLTVVLIASNALQRQATGWLHVHEGEHQESANPFIDIEEGTPFDRINTAMKAVADIWLRNFFVTTPLIGFFFYVFFRERRPTYPPHFVLGLELASFGVLVLLVARWFRIVWVLIPPHHTFRESTSVGSFVLIGVIAVATLTISTLAIRRFYEIPLWKAVAASPLLLLAPVTILTIISFAVTFGILMFTS